MKRKRLTKKQLRAIFAKQRAGSYVAVVKGKRNTEISNPFRNKEEAEKFMRHQKGVVIDDVDVYVDEL